MSLFEAPTVSIAKTEMLMLSADNKETFHQQNYGIAWEAQSRESQD